MASIKPEFILFFTCSLFIHGNSEKVICEKLPTNLCSFAVSSAGKRCVLENYSADDDDSVSYTCKSSEIAVNKLYGYIESDACVRACGVDRGFVGISSDPLLSHEFPAHLCSNACYGNCPNIVDLFFNLAAGEGVFLPAFCDKLRKSTVARLPILSAGDGVVAAAPQTSLVSTPGPAPSPAFVHEVRRRHRIV